MDLIPLPYKLGILMVMAALLSVTFYVKGRSSLKADMAALKQGYEIAAAQAAGREAERSRMWQQAAIQAGRQYDERAKMADSSFNSSIDRLRSAYASSSGRVQPAAAVAGECQATGGSTAAELLGMGETVARLVQQADRDRAALISCVAAWPR